MRPILLLSVVVKVKVEIWLRVEKEDGTLVGKKMCIYAVTCSQSLSESDFERTLCKKKNEHPRLRL